MLNGVLPRWQDFDTESKRGPKLGNNVDIAHTQENALIPLQCYRDIASVKIRGLAEQSSQTNLQQG